MPIAWTSIGSGPPLVYCSMIFNFERALGPDMPYVLWTEIAKGRQLIVYDGLGSGLSDRGFEDFSIANSVADLAAVADAARLEQFAICANLMGSQAELSYCAKYPQRVDRLVIVNGMAKGLLSRNPTRVQLAQREAMLAAIEAGWDDPTPAYRLLNPQSGNPKATYDEQLKVAEVLKSAISSRGFVRFLRAQSEADVSDKASQISCPALIVHARSSARIPFEEGKRPAGLIPGAILLPIEGANMIPHPSDETFAEVVAAAKEFLGQSTRQHHKAVLGAELTPRELDVLELVAKGLDNLQIAARLGLSEKTIRNNIAPIFEKLQVENRMKAIVKAREAGFGQMEQHPQD